MRRRSQLAIPLLATGMLWGQPPVASLPAASNIPGAEYPRVHDDLRVTFQLRAPDAKKVQVQLGQTWDMTRSEDGAWSVPIPRQVPGFAYSLLLDGVVVIDPSSQTFCGTSKQSSGIEIPEKGVDKYDMKAVPHGEIRQLRLQGHAVLAAGIRLYASALRRRAADALSGALSPARGRGG